MKDWFMRSELIFVVYFHRTKAGAVKVIVDNAEKGDEEFMAAVARLITVRAKEGLLCKRLKPKSA